MCRWQIRVLPWLSLILLGCGFADLRPIGIQTIPEGPGEILPDPFSPVVLIFDTEVEKGEAEALLRIGSDSGTVEGDLFWEGNRLSFVPLGAWKPGIRYVLRLSGTLDALDGRTATVTKSIPVCAPAAASRPVLVSFSPAEGASTEVSPPGETLLELDFSLPMDRKSTEEELVFDIPGEKIFTWSGEDTKLRVSSGEALAAWTLYRWSLSEKVLGRDGAPLAKTAEGRFITDLDRVFPELVRIMPLARREGDLPDEGIWGEWVPLAPNLERGLGSAQALGLEFSKSMNGESLLRSISFEPSLSGRTEQLSSRSFVFVPERDPDPETSYTLKVSGRVLDAGGLSLGEDYSLVFSSDIPYLKLLSLAVDRAESELTEVVHRGCYFLPIDLSKGGAARFILRFSLPFETEALREGALAIELEPHFPPSLPAVFLRFAGRVKKDRIRMVWEGLEGGSAAEPHYYRLRIPGGRNGLHTGEGSYGGSYLREDLIIYFKAEAQ
jgi:hypothetical protein